VRRPSRPGTSGIDTRTLDKQQGKEYLTVHLEQGRLQSNTPALYLPQRAWQNLHGKLQTRVFPALTLSISNMEQFQSQQEKKKDKRHRNYQQVRTFVLGALLVNYLTQGIL
jgi:hypothetical protein